MDDAVGDHHDAGKTLARNVAESRAQRREKPRAVVLFVAAGVYEAQIEIAKRLDVLLQRSFGRAVCARRWPNSCEALSSTTTVTTSRRLWRCSRTRDGPPSAANSTGESERAPQNAAMAPPELEGQRRQRQNGEQDENGRRDERRERQEKAVQWSSLSSNSRTCT